MQRANGTQRKTNLFVGDIRSYRTGKSTAGKDKCTYWREHESGALDLQHDTRQRSGLSQNQPRSKDGFYIQYEETCAAGDGNTG